MSLQNYNVKKLRFSKRYFLIPVIFIVFILLFYLVYNDVKDKTINEFNNQQLILAQAASRGITSFFQNYQYELNFLSQQKCIIDFNDDTRVLMENFYTNHKNLIKAVTRVDSRGKILFTYPYNQSAIGQDISYQKHIRQVLATHQTVISDVFMSVQGYLAVAMHVPVFKGKEFKGSIAILIQIDKLGKQYFGKIKIRETSNAWLLSENGIEIFCLIKGHTGKSFLDITHNDPSTIELMKKLKKENKGNAISIHEEKSIDGQTEFIEKHITFYRVPLGNTYWTIIISHNEEDIYAALDSFRNRLILIFTFLFIVLIYYFYSLAKVRTLLNEEAKRKETEKTLYESEEKFRTLFETAVEGILIADLKNRKFKYSNPAICQMLGYNEVEFRQLGVEDIHPKESLEHVRAEFEAQAKGEKTLAAGLPCLRKDGSILYVDINTSMAVIDGEECNIGFFTDITERKKSEKDLLESQANITDLVKHTPDGVLIANTDGKHLFANQRMCEMTGYDYEELMNLTIREMTPPDELKKYQEMYDKRLKGEKVPSQYERTLVRKDGKVIPVELRTTTTIWNGAKCSLAFLTDISERKLSEETLKQSQLKYKQLFNDDLTGNFVISLDGTIELCNPAMAKIFGCDSVDELMKSNISEFYRNTEDRGKLLDLIREKKKVERYEQEHITRDGRVIILIKNVIGEFDENGVLIRLKGSMFDNTERKRAEKELQEKEIRYRTLFNVSPSGVVLADLDGIIIDVNESFCKSVSYARDELIEKNIRILVPPQNLPGVEENIKEILSGNIVEHIVKNVKKDGTLCDMELRESLVILPDGRKGILSTANDITERKRAEQILQKLNMAIRNSNEVVFMTDKEGIITYINPEFTKMYGYTAEEVIGKTTPRILKSGLLTSEQSEYLWKTLLNKQSISTAPYTNKCKDGSLIDIEGSADSIIDENGEIIGFLAIQRDITQRKLAEKELIEAKEKAEQSNKLKDAFIANMSHEIRTPLNGILGLSSLIKDTYAELINEEDEELFVGIDQSSQRIIRTIDMILNYSRIQTGEFPISPDQIEISLICENLVKEFTTAAKSKCLELSFENRCGKTITIFSDEYSVTNAISNLIDNAIKYTNEGAIDVILYSGKNDEILLDIKDSGIGIGEEYLQHIFEPYQQEQMGYGRAYEGIGLGLSMVKNFLNLNNATISIDSKKEKGTTFTINFGKSLQPLAEKITEVKIDRTFAKQEKQSKPLVLIVEDDAINQMTIIRFISDSYNTISTDSSEGAIELLKNNKVDMILMDISIKGSKNGLELTKELKASKEYLHIPIIGVTAHAFESDRNNALEAGCDDYLSKPFSKNLLLDTMGKFV